MVSKHKDNIPILAKGFQETRKYLPDQVITSFLDRAIRNRITLRLQGEQHLSLSAASLPSLSHTPSTPSASSTSPQDQDPLIDPSSRSPTLGSLEPSRVGVLDLELSPAELIDACAAYVSELCEAAYGVAPRYEIVGAGKDSKIGGIGVHLEYIVTEILKNAFRATVEYHTPKAEEKDPDVFRFEDLPSAHMLKSDFPPVVITIATAPGVLTVRLLAHSDFRYTAPENLPNIFSYSFTTVPALPEPDYDPDSPGLDLYGGAANAGYYGGVGGGPQQPESALRTGMGTLAGLGFGLPLSRIYAEYWDGRTGSSDPFLIHDPLRRKHPHHQTLPLSLNLNMLTKSALLTLALYAFAQASPNMRFAKLVRREVPQEHSHEQFLTTVRASLNLNNPDSIQDPVFGLLGNAAASAGQGSITDTDCLQQATADQAFTNAKAAGDVDGMTAALVYRALERNTGAVGTASVLCTSITPVNAEIAAISQHQDPASSGAAATNKAITLELAKQIASIGGDPHTALKSGTFAPGTIGDPTAAGNTCDDQNDATGCIFTQNLLVEDATADEISSAVAGVATSASSTSSASATSSAASSTITSAASSATAAATSSADDDVLTVTVTEDCSASSATPTATPITVTVQPANCPATSTSAVLAVSSSASSASSSATAAAATSTSASSGTNLQTFTGDLGGSLPPAVVAGGRGFITDNGDSFINLSAALQRSCSVQNNACADAANASGNTSFTVGDCNTQVQQKYAAVSKGEPASSDEEVASSSGGEQSPTTGAAQPPTQRPSRRAPGSAPAAAARPGGGGQQRKSGYSTTCKVFTVVIIVVLLVGAGVGGYFAYNHFSNSTSSDATDTTSSATTDSAPSSTLASDLASSPAGGTTTASDLVSSLNSASAGATGNFTGSTNSSAIAGATASPGMATPTTNSSGIATGVTSAPGAVTTAASGSAAPATLESGGRVMANVTYFFAKDEESSCGTTPNDNSYVAHVSKDLYGDTSARSALCGKWITTWDPSTNFTVNATIQDYCDTCTGYQLDLSRATFHALTDDLDLGVAEAQWWYLPAEADGSYPVDSLTTDAVTHAREKLKAVLDRST
ncbi:hypothetical protein MNV49_007362 [Pseudohyphozyma bogoriensis]|nr:hypothetical protein MNV49_007362 [Pseudohyphozyma bogoriensis]